MRRYQSRLLWQNRLRHSDYGRLFECAGFAVIEQTKEVVPEDLAALAGLPVAAPCSDLMPRRAER